MITKIDSLPEKKTYGMWQAKTSINNSLIVKLGIQGSLYTLSITLCCTVLPNMNMLNKLIETYNPNEVNKLWLTAFEPTSGFLVARLL